MLHKSLTMAASVLLLGSFACLQAEPSRQNLPSLAISVFDQVQLPVGTLERAESRAAMVLGAAGLQVTWVQCTSSSGQMGMGTARPFGCEGLAYPAHLSVRIVWRDELQKQKACGRSWLDEQGMGVRSAVSYSCVAASAQGFIDERDLLGYVIAHEIGHLLLGPHAHSPLGLMRAHWGPDELREAALGRLYFSSQEEARLRSRLESVVARSINGQGGSAK